MLKVRITFTETEKGREDLAQIIKILEEHTTVLSESQIYKGRGRSLYSNQYLDIEVDKEEG